MTNKVCYNEFGDFMEKGYINLLKLLERIDGEDQLKNIDIYVGEINGRYDTAYNDDEKEVLDTISTDGDILPNLDDNKVSYNVSDAKYTLITRYGNVEGKKNVPEVKKLSLFLNESSLTDFRSCFLEFDKNNGSELYLKVFNSKNYKGSVGNYINDNEKGHIVYPSPELIDYNRELHGKIDSNIFLR